MDLTLRNNRGGRAVDSRRRIINDERFKIRGSKRLMKRREMVFTEDYLAKDEDRLCH